MGGAMYVDGGDDDLYDSIEVFDIKVGKWKIAGATLPKPMEDLRASNIYDSILIFGVVGSNRSPRSQDVMRL